MLASRFSNKLLLSAVVILLSSLSCTQAVITPTATPTQIPTATPTIILTATLSPTPLAEDGETAIVRQFVVNIHEGADVNSAVIGWVSGGDTVTVLDCDGDWCQIEQGYIWRGCLDGFAEDRKCEAR